MAFKFVPQAYCPKTFIKKVERIAAIKAKIEQLQQKKNHKPSKTAKFAAELLFKTLKEHNLVVCKPDLEDWAREFSWFFNKHGDEFAKRVIRLLKWYSNNISDQWTPKAYNAEEFISKIKRIEDAMTRKEATQKAADDDSVFREHPYYQPPSKSNYYSNVPTNGSKDREGQKAINLPPDLDVKQLWLNGRL
ncbi:MAG: hypothetical protein KatS3mg087_1217 [Patescibacteria group bacterium]|nr:MAG: hypothetical protein KatS3mg087_1217 [Patescibacteria group bacterium]